MADSDKDFEDEFDAAEELDALWDDEIDEDGFSEVDSDDDAPKKKKSGFSKLILFLLLIGFVAYAGYMFMGTLVTPNSQNEIPVVQIETPQEQTAETEGEDVLNPEKTEIATDAPDTKETLDTSEELNNVVTLDNVETDTILTPMPENLENLEIPLPDLDESSADNLSQQPKEIVDTQDTNAQNTEITDLEDELLSKTEEPFAEETNIAEDVVENQNLTPLELIEQQIKQAQMEAEQQALNALSTDEPPQEETETSFEEDVTTLATDIQENLDTQALASDEAEIPAAIEEAASDMASEAQDNTPETSEVIADTEQETAPQEEIVADLQEESAINESQEDTTPPVIETETTQVAETVEEVTETPQAIEAVEDVVDVVPTQKPEAPEVKKPATPKKTITKKTAPKKAKKKWIIRAAQSGKAVIYDMVSTEMKSIEVGDTVNGLGRIKFIGKKDGRWLIDGTVRDIVQ